MDILAHYVKGILFIIITEDKFITMEESRKYFAFISYQRQDEEWADWLQHQLEHYHLPANIVSDHPELPKDIRPLFRDKTELAGGVLAKEIRSALENSRYLIVICSPNSAKSEWVDKEVQSFIDMGRTDKIIPFIIDGSPYSNETECFSASLRSLRGSELELLGINIAEMGREVASIKVIAHMLGLKFDSLWQRYEREKEEEQQRIREQRDKLLKVQSHFLAEKAQALLKEGDSYTARLLALEALPKNLKEPDRPYVFEAGTALREACIQETAIFDHEVISTACRPQGDCVAAASKDGTIKVFSIKSGSLVYTMKSPEPVYSLSFNSDGNLLLVGTDNILWIWEYPSLKLKEKLICDEEYQEDREEEMEEGYEEEYEEDEERRISTIAVSPNNDYVAAVSVLSENIWIFDLNKRVLLYETNGISVSFSQKEPWALINNSYSTSNNICVFILNLQTGEQICSVNINKDICVFYPIGQKIAVVDNKQILLYDLKSSQRSVEDIFQSIVSQSHEDPFPRNIYPSSAVGQFEIDPQKGQELFTATNQIDGINFMQDFILVWSPDGMVSQWDYYGHQLFEQKFIDGPVKSLCAIDNNIFGISENGILHKSLIPNYRPCLIILGYKKFTEVGISNGRKRMFPDRDIYSAHFDQSGNRIKIVSKDRLFGEFSYFLKLSGVDIKVYISIFDAITGSLLDEKEDFEDKNRKVSIHNGIEEDLDSPSFFDEIVNDAYTANKKYRASVEKNRVRVFDESTNRIVMSFTASYSNIRLIEFSPDGKKIMTVSDDSVIRLWSFAPLQHLIDETKERFEKRPLSKEEREKHYLDFK